MISPGATTTPLPKLIITPLASWLSTVTTLEAALSKTCSASIAPTREEVATSVAQQNKALPRQWRGTMRGYLRLLSSYCASSIGRGNRENKRPVWTDCEDILRP